MRHGRAPLYDRSRLARVSQVACVIVTLANRIPGWVIWQIFTCTIDVSELLEIPTVVASTDLLGIFPLSMGPQMKKQLRDGNRLMSTTKMLLLGMMGPSHRLDPS
jgi:hypothetical protein